MTLYKITLTTNEYLTLMNYIGLIKFFVKNDENLCKIHKLIERNTQIKDVILRSKVTYNIDFSNLTLLRNFIIEQLNRPLAKYDIDKEIFASILHKIDISLASTN
jgi:hypothetical protein